MNLAGRQTIVFQAGSQSKKHEIRGTVSGHSEASGPLFALGAFPDKTGYAVGSVEGRCSIAYIEDSSKNFAFKQPGTQRKSDQKHRWSFLVWLKNGGRFLAYTSAIYFPKGHL